MSYESKTRAYPGSYLTHWGRVTHICVGKLTITGSDNGLSPGRRQAIIWSNAGILLSRTLGTNFSEILGEIHSFSFSKMHLKMSAKWRLFGLDLNELRLLWCVSVLVLRDVSKHNCAYIRRSMDVYALYDIESSPINLPPGLNIILWLIYKVFINRLGCDKSNLAHFSGMLL